MIDRKRILFIPTVFSTLLVFLMSGWSVPAFSQEPVNGALAGTTATHNTIRQNLNNGVAPVPNSVPQPVACPAIPDFVWDNGVAATAQAWADTCNIGQHSQGTGNGENIAWGGGVTGPGSTINWSNEVFQENYNYNEGGNTHSCNPTGEFFPLSNCAHYTQVVWASSTRLGCGYADCNGTDFVVCQYAPAGNVNIATTRPYCTATQTTNCETGPGVCGGGGNQLLTVAKNGTGAGTVTSAPAGINCGGDCTENYPDTTQVTLTAAAAGGSNFVGWGGDCLFAAANPTCQITMNAAKNVTATFNIGGGGNACAGAMDLVCGVPFDGNTFNATADFDGYNCAGGAQAGTDVVFKLVPPQGGNVTVDLVPNVSDLDLFVINGCDTNNCSGGSENFPGSVPEQVIFAAVGGQTYDVIVEDFTSAGDTFTLTATCPGGQCNAPDGQNQVLTNTNEAVDRTVQVCGTITTGINYIINGGAHVTLIAPTSVRLGNGLRVQQNGRLTAKHN